MKRLFRTAGMALVLAGTIISGGCETDIENKGGPDTSVENKNTTILVHLETSDNFSLMTKAIQLAGLENLLGNASVNYTILAPNDIAIKEYLSTNGYEDLEELKEHLGDRKFRNLVAYHIIEGKYDVRTFPRGFVNVHAQNASELQLDVLVKDDVRTGISFNGTNDHSAIKTENRTVSAVNGNVMEITQILTAQSNLENFTEGFTADYEYFHSIYKGAGSYFRELLRYENGMVMLGGNEVVEILIQLNFRKLINGNILKTMLDSRNLQKLMQVYGVNNLEDLASVVEYDDLKRTNLISVENLLDSFSAREHKILTDYTFLNTGADSGNINESDRAYNRAGVNFEIEVNGSYLVLTDPEENQFYLDAEPVSGINGAIYKLVKVNLGR